MKKVLITALVASSIFASSVFAGKYEDSFREPKDVFSVTDRLKYNAFANSAKVANTRKKAFSLRDINFELYYSRTDELVILRRYLPDESRWSWTLVGDVDVLERDCRAQGGTADCTELDVYLLEFTDRATMILQRDYGNVVIIPETWEDGLDDRIVNNVHFDESNIILSFSR